MSAELQVMVTFLSVQVQRIRGLRDERGGGSSSVENLILIGGAITLALAIVSVIAAVVKSHTP